MPNVTIYLPGELYQTFKMEVGKSALVADLLTSHYEKNPKKYKKLTGDAQAIADRQKRFKELQKRMRTQNKSLDEVLAEEPKYVPED